MQFHCYFSAHHCKYTYNSNTDYLHTHKHTIVATVSLFYCISHRFSPLKYSHYIHHYHPVHLPPAEVQQMVFWVAFVVVLKLVGEYAQSLLNPVQAKSLYIALSGYCNVLPGPKPETKYKKKKNQRERSNIASINNGNFCMYIYE